MQGFHPSCGLAWRCRFSRRTRIYADSGSPVAETVEVAGARRCSPQRTLAVGTVIENSASYELPLNGRNFLQLVALSPQRERHLRRRGCGRDRQAGSELSKLLGRRHAPEFNNYTLDGSPTPTSTQHLHFLPSIDALQEFKVQTGIYSASSGAEAAQVNISQERNERIPRRSV